MYTCLCADTVLVVATVDTSSDVGQNLISVLSVFSVSVHSMRAGEFVPP